MMWLRIIDLFAISLLYCSIERGSASNLFTFGQKSPTAEYERLKSSNVHRGIFLALSALQKNDMCQDIYGSQLYILPGDRTEGEESRRSFERIKDTHRPSETPYEHRLTVQKLKQQEEPLFEEEALSFECSGLQFMKRVPISYKWIHLTSAFRPKWLYSTKNNRRYENLEGYHLEDFVALSPDYIPLEQADLEQRYVNTLKNIMALSKESPKYMELIDKRDDLSTLSGTEKLILCASILSSRIYRKERLEFSLSWMYDAIDNETILDYKKDISVKSNPTEKKMKINCTLCTAFEDATEEDDPKSTNLYLASSRTDKYSIVVFKQENDDIFVDKSFKNIPILRTERGDLDYGYLTIDFHLQEHVTEYEIKENVQLI